MLEIVVLILDVHIHSRSTKTTGQLGQFIDYSQIICKFDLKN